MSCFWGHKWSKWKTYKWHGMLYDKWSTSKHEVTETRQCRVCEECGKEEHSILSEAAGSTYDTVKEIS